MPTRFIRSLFFYAIVVVLLIVAGNYMINPLGLYPTTVIPPITTMSHRDKLERWNALEVPPEIIILGSSRSATAPVTELEQKTGKSVFNASIFGASPRDYLAFLRYVIFHKRPPKFFIVGLGMEQITTGSNPFFEPPSGLASFMEDSPGESLQRVTDLLDISQTQASFKSLISVAMFGATIPGNYFDANGVIKFPDPPNFELAIDQNISHIMATGDLNTTEIQHLKDFMELCREQNIYVIIYLPPYQPRMMETLEASPGYLPVLTQLKAILRSLRPKYNFAFYDLTHIETVSGTGDMFYDGLHPRPEAQLLIHDFILRNTPRLNESDAF